MKFAREAAFIVLPPSTTMTEALPTQPASGNLLVGHQRTPRGSTCEHALIHNATRRHKKDAAPSWER